MLLLQLLIANFRILIFQTCLSKGQGYHFPPCYMLEIGGFRVLLDCPMDLSTLQVFAPIPAYSKKKLKETFDCSCCVSLETDPITHKRRKVEHCLDACSLIHAVPWYKTVSTLHLWDLSFIDVVLISSPTGMLGLPFLTRKESFSAKVHCHISCSLGFNLMKHIALSDVVSCEPDLCN